MPRIFIESMWTYTEVIELADLGEEKLRNATD